MPSRTASTGSTPVVFDRFFVPLMFGPYAEETGRRIAGIAARNILEVACGSGAATKAIHDALPEAEIHAVDVNQRMIECALKRLSSPRVHYEAADVAALPFANRNFDMAVCNFGFTVFEDKAAAHAEIHRVLRPGSPYWITSWDRLEQFTAIKAASDALGPFLPAGVPNFLSDVAHAYGDPDRIRRDVAAAGFKNVELDTVELARPVDARALGEALSLLPAIRTHLEQGRPGTIAAAEAAMTEALAPWDGKDMPTSAHFVTAVR